VSPVEIGEVLREKYLIEQVLGQGGVGIVFAAHNLELDERVALKFLRADVAHDPDVILRFAQEAKASASIKSEYVARVFDVGTTRKGVPFLVMEYLAGRDLSSEVEKGGPLPMRDAVEYVIQACDALASAHAKGIVHRDIKPENLFLVDRGDSIPVIKVLDFGISKAVLTGSVFGAAMVPLGPGKIMGSPLYMSPEQIRSTDCVDPRGDIWSLGIVLYELLTGVTPFNGETLEEVFKNIKEGEPTPLTVHKPKLPEELNAIIFRCIAKKPADRYKNVAELAIELLPFAPKRARLCAERACTVLVAAGMADARMRVVSSTPPAMGEAMEPAPDSRGGQIPVPRGSASSLPRSNSFARMSRSSLRVDAPYVPAAESPPPSAPVRAAGGGPGKTIAIVAVSVAVTAVAMVLFMRASRPQADALTPTSSAAVATPAPRPPAPPATPQPQPTGPQVVTVDVQALPVAPPAAPLGSTVARPGASAGRPGPATAHSGPAGAKRPPGESEPDLGY
jgi:serine/threonine-protein kinase